MTFVLKFVLTAVLLLGPSIAQAQFVRPIHVVPIKFQNDLREPWTNQQIVDYWKMWQDWTDITSNGILRWDVTILPYVTIPKDRPKDEFTGGGWNKACYEDWTTTTTWSASAKTAAVAAGYPSTATYWVMSPQTFGMCSEVDRVFYMADNRNFGFFFAQMLGLSSFMFAPVTICTDGNSAFVPLSNTCVNGLRTFMGIDGQGNGGPTCAERVRLASMPATRQVTLAIGATLPQSFTIAPLEQIPVGNEIQCLTIGHYATGTLGAVTFELHKWDTRIPWSNGWQTGGLAGHLAGTSRFLDFTPDGKPTWSNYAGDGVLNPGKSFNLNGVTITVGQFNATGGLPVTVSAGAPPPPPPPPPPQDPSAEFVWFDDSPPTGAVLTGEGDSWSWVSSPVQSGARAHQSSLGPGLHQHYFTNAAPMTVATGSRLFTYVFLDPATPPSQVMLQWNDGTWEHRAYWGANSIPWGTDGTNSRRYMGPLPPVGTWVRLEVPASAVGLEGRSVTGAAFTLFGGRVTWDKSGTTGSGTTPPPPPPPPPPSDPCVVSPLIPVVSITATGRVLSWPSFVVTDDRGCLATVPAKP